MRFLLGFLIAAVLVGPAAARASNGDVKAEQIYARAVELMKHEPQPQNAAYTVDVHVRGAGFLLSKTPDGKAAFGFTIGDPKAKPDATFAAAYRGSDGIAAVNTAPGEWATTTIPIFDPTWNGISDWIHFGFQGRPANATPSPSPSPEAGLVPQIASVVSLGVAYYTVYDRGAGRCANGEAGYGVHLVAHRDPSNHPLTDAMVDVSTGALCAATFAYRQPGAVSARIVISVDLDRVNGMPVVTGESFVITLHALAFAVHQITSVAHYRDFTFPPTLDPALFATPRTVPRGDGRRGRFFR